MASFGGNYGRSLQDTPTWAVAVVCFVLVGISLIIEEIIHHLGSWLKKTRKPNLYEALEKVKAELMLLGFLSLLLVVGQERLSEICIPRQIGHSWHPCNYQSTSTRYRDPCEERDRVQFISSYGIHQLHIFIFVLAITHILYCFITLGLGSLKMRKWRFWEDETRTIQYQYVNDPERFRFARDTSFGRRHMNFWSKSSVSLWIVCFFRQFFTSVEKVDYLTLRHGFITAHLAPQSQENFNFQKYIKRSLEEDFKVVVGISPTIWLSSIIFLLSNTNGWYSHFWLPFIPLIIILLIGAKLQVIITKMGIKILRRGDVIKGTPVVEPNDDLFWFNRPGLLLFLIHLVLFTNAFQLAFFAWSWYEFGYPSCYHENLEDMVIRVSMGIIIQVLCSYVTLPLYALVTQMGTSMKPVIFSDQVASALKGWHRTAKKHLKEDQKSGHTTPFSSRPGTPLHGSLSPVHLLRGQMTYHDSVEGGRQISPRRSSVNNEGWGGERRSPVHLFRGQMTYHDSVEGGRQISPRRSSVSNEDWDGERRSVSPRHHEIELISQHEIDIDDSTRNVVYRQSEIERYIENPGSPRYGSQHIGEGSSSDFSFGEKQRSR